MKDQLQELQRTLLSEIPITKCLGIHVVGYNGQYLIMQAPLLANVNHKQTAFAGSLNALMTLTGWGLIWLMLRELEIGAQIVIQDSASHYQRPITRDFSAFCCKPHPTQVEKFEYMLRKRGRARLELEVEIREEDRIAVSFTGRYVAHLDSSETSQR